MPSPGLVPSPVSTTAAGRLASKAPGSVSFDRRNAAADDHTPGRSHGVVHEQRPVGGQSNRRDAAVLHPGQLHCRLHRGERGLADIKLPLDQAVHICACRGEHHARRHPRRAVTTAGHDHAVGRLARRYAVPFAERGGVRQLRVDLRHADVVDLEQLPARSLSAAATGAASKSGRSSAGTAVRLPMCIVTPGSLGAASCRGCPTSRCPGAPCSCPWCT